MRGIAVNFVPLAGSVFAAAVVTNKDRVAVTYWNLGLDGCRDPIPPWPLTATYSGPVIPIEPIVEPVSTLAFKYADSSWWGMGISVHTFPRDAVLPRYGYQIVWNVVGAPALTLTQTW